MTTLDELSKQVESLRAEVAELTARPPSIVVNRGDQLVVQYANPLQSQVILECKAAPESTPPAKPQPIDGKVGDIYEYDGKKWRLVKWAKATKPSRWIAFSDCVRKDWSYIADSSHPSAPLTTDGHRWHVEEVTDPAPPKCPMCDRAMHGPSPHQNRFVCMWPPCQVRGPNGDPTGSKVRKLVNIDKLPKVTWDAVSAEQAKMHWRADTSSDQDKLDGFNHFAGHIIVASEPTKGDVT